MPACARMSAGESFCASALRTPWLSRPLSPLKVCIALLAVSRALLHTSPQRTMEKALKNRLTFGPLMVGGLFLLLWLDDWLQYKTRPWMESRFGGRGGVGGIGILILLAIILPLATREITTLFTAERVRPWRFISATGSALLIVHAFLTQ